MIVECPNCFLEQPLDKYCAGCGKELDKLIAEKKERRSARIKQANYSITALCLIFILGSYIYYSKLSKEQASFSIEIDESSSIDKLKLPETKITYNRTKSSTKAFQAQPVQKKKVAKKKKALPAKSAASEEAFENKKIDTVYFISLENCDESFNPGEFSKEKAQSLLACANVHLQTQNLKYDEILEDGVSFATQVHFEIDDLLAAFTFTLTTDLYEEEYKQTFSIDMDEDSFASLWTNIGHDIESTEPPDAEMLSSYATTALFNLAPDSSAPPKLYFLATYK